MLTPAVLAAAGFLQDLGSREGDLISLGAHGCHLFNAAMPSAPCTGSHGVLLWARLRVAVLRSAIPWGLLLKQRLGCHFRARLTHGSGLAGGWQRGWGTAAMFPGTNRAMPGAPVWDSPWSQALWCQSSQRGAGMWSQWSVPTPATQGSVAAGLWAESRPAREKDVLSRFIPCWLSS